MVSRVIVMRHSHRHGTVPGTHDPQLTELGHEQARRIAASPQEFGLTDVDAIFASPYLRAIQTAAPLAAALRQPIRVDRGFGEIMLEPRGSPIGTLHYDLKHRDSLPAVEAGLVVEDSGSPAPEFPDIAGPDFYRRGDTEQRRRTVARHQGAIERVLAAGREAGWSTVLVIAHACSSDFIADALLGERYSARYSVLHTDLDGPAFALVPHASLTTFVRRGDEWVLESWAEPTVSTGVENGGGSGSSL